MSWYDRWILPKLTDLAMRQGAVQKYRRELVPAARGRVLEAGVGSGVNLPLYAPGVSEVIGLDPSERLLDMARRRAATAGVPVTLTQGTATAVPMADNCIGTRVMTWTLCSIPHPMAAPGQLRRGLKPGASP